MSETDYPYIGLGNLVRRWRTTRYRTASEFIAACKPAIGEADYLEIEAGRKLATPQLLGEIAQALGEDPREALLVWAQVQMTLPEHKALFSRQSLEFDGRSAQKSNSPSEILKIRSNQIPSSEFEHTWIFGEYEREQLAKYPWIFSFLVGLATVFPAEVPFSAYKFHSDEELRIFEERYLKTWIKQKHIEVSRSGFRLTQRYLHIPKTAEWQSVRDSFLGNILEALIPMMTPELIAARKSHRTQIHKVLTEQQRDWWIARLGELEMEFALTPQAKPDDTTPVQTYSLMVLMAPRELGLPAHITKGRRKFNSAA